MKKLHKTIPGILACGLLTVFTCRAGTPALSFKVTFLTQSQKDEPKIRLENTSPLSRITGYSMTIGKTTEKFDYLQGFSSKSGSGIGYSDVVPDEENGGEKGQVFSLKFSNFDPGEWVEMELDVDGGDYRKVFFNNGDNYGNSVITVTGPDGASAEITLTDGPTDRSSYTWDGGAQPRVLTVSSVTEAPNSTTYVPKVKVVVYDGSTEVKTYDNVGQRQPVDAFDGATIEISCPQRVYENIFGADITDRAENDADVLQNEAEERFSAIGISVNNELQTGDPTFYRFDVDDQTDIIVKWRHEFALTIEQDFAETASVDLDITGSPWAGPLTSWASGSPDPSAKKHWIRKGETVTAEIDGSEPDFSRPNLEIRYVPRAYMSYGPPRPNGGESHDADDIAAADPDDPNHIAARDVLRNEETAFALKPLPQRQQVGGEINPAFTMYGPGGIKYVWRIQYGVKVNVDDIARTGLPRVYEWTGSAWQTAGVGEGTFWFNPGAKLRVGCKANVTDENSTSLKGWYSGDGYFFSDTGAIDDTQDGELVEGGPTAGAATWLTEFPDVDSGQTYRGMEIPQLHRAARVMWRYGPPAIAIDVTIGKYAFQDDPKGREDTFITEPDNISIIRIDGQNQTVAEADVAVWDPEASRLYPVVPGMFRAQWRPDPNSSNVVDVMMTVVYPTDPHYRHVVDTPPVALDPDPDDDFLFKEIKYTENSAGVDANDRFTAGQAGKSVLLFGQIQRVGRGTPREFLAVRVVDTKNWNTGLREPLEVIVGRKITDSALDLAELGTGYVLFEGARYNPHVYDATKLEGLAAVDLYDMDALRSDSAEKNVVQPDNLPGPVIPVNLHPGAADNERVVVVWYDDPSDNDELMWPYTARVYKPRWPRDASEGLGRIVIASQYGSESLGADGLDQLVAEEITTVVTDDLGNPTTNVVPEEYTYNPSRLQQVQVYSQADPLEAGYNPNEEHALMAPSLRYADVSPRPPAAYALRDNDLNIYNRASPDEQVQPQDYSSHPYVLVQYYDTADSEFKMRVYSVQKEAPEIDGYRLVNRTLVTPPAGGIVTAPPRTLLAEPHVPMEAGEPVIPFYPLGEVIGASPSPETYGVNIKGQTTYWEDHKGTSWAISGGENAWFTHHVYYGMAPDFWWPPDKPGMIVESVENNIVVGRLDFPQVGDSVAFLPPYIAYMLSRSVDEAVSIGSPPVFLLPHFEILTDPSPVLYRSEWPDNPPILKAGETLTFQGGEYRTDNPLTPIINQDGEIEEVETPGLPAIVAFATAEVVFDSLNPTADADKWKTQWTARVAQVLEERSVPLSLADFPPDLQPATQRTRSKSGKYVFNELPASLQKRVLYDPVGGKLMVIGQLNEKEIGDSTLTAAPPAVYVLEPNIITDEEEEALLALSPDNDLWQTAVEELVQLSRNPSLIDSDNADIPDPTDSEYRSDLEAFWEDYYRSLGELSATAPVPPPIAIADSDDAYRVGLQPTVLRDGNGNVVTIEDPLVPGLQRVVYDPKQSAPLRGFGPGLALVPNAGFLDPAAGLPEESWITVVENNDPSLGGSPITPHIIKVDRGERYRGAIKTIESDNVFDENLVLRHQGDFGANADELFFEWWYRPDDGSLNVPPPDLIPTGQTNPWKLFPDPTGARGKNRFQVTLKGNPNAPEALIADTWWFCRYRHDNDTVEGTDWAVQQDNDPDEDSVNFTWAGAGNSDPFNDFDGDGIKDYRAQLAMGWIKRVLDAVNPYEARIRDFEGESPATVASMIQQFGPRYEGPVALNPDKDVIENVGLIELYETILKRGKDLTIDLSRPVSTPAVANALQLAATRISDFYAILAHEAYGDAVDPTIGHGSESAAYGALAPAVFAFQNQMSSLIEEELGLLRGVDDYFARPVYNRLFWNFTKGEGEAAYAVNYNIWDITLDGFVDEDDAMTMFPQGHGDAWGHYLTAVRNQYDLLKHRYFNWVSRSEFYNLQDIVIKVDFLDERKFAQMAAARAKAGAEIVNLTYREKYVEDPTAQWQGYTDGNKDRSWGVQGWARRVGQGAYFDWLTANALLPSEHPNETLEGIQKVDRQSNSDIAVVSANLNGVQRTFDDANNGYNPLGLAGNVMPFDLNPEKIESLRVGRSHFEQIYDRALLALKNAQAVWNNANLTKNMLRKMSNNELAFKNKTFQQDLSYRNRLIKIFGKPYEGTIGSGKIYPAGYDGPDLLLYMYVDVRNIDNSTVPGPTTTFATFNNGGTLTGGEIFDAFVWGTGSSLIPSIPGLDVISPGIGTGLLPGLYSVNLISDDVRQLFAPTFAMESINFGPLNIPTGITPPVMAEDGLYAVNYTDLSDPKIPLERLDMVMPVTAAGYTFQAPRDWGQRQSIGELQVMVNQLIQQEAQVAKAIGAWDGLQGGIIRKMRIINAKLQLSTNIRLKNEIYNRTKYIINNTIKAIEGVVSFVKAARETTTKVFDATQEGVPKALPMAGLAISPQDAMAPARAGIKYGEVPAFTGMKVTEAVLAATKTGFAIALDITDNELKLWEAREKDALAAKEMLVSLENMVGDEPIKRIAIFKEIESLRQISQKYRRLLDEGTRLIDERESYNKRVAAQTQRDRYQDMTFRVTRNHALQTYRSAFNVAARYAYLAAKAYDYETNLDAGAPASPSQVFEDIVRARSVGYISGTPQMGKGGLAESLAWLAANYAAQKSQLGFNNPQAETGKMSLRTELYRIMPKGYTQPDEDGFPTAGANSDDLWRNVLLNAKVEDLWMVPEYRNLCKPFSAESDESGNHIAEPGIVLRFGTEIVAGKNFFGNPLSGGDHAYDPSRFATKIRSVGVWFSDYLSTNVLTELPDAPRAYLIPIGTDVMRCSTGDDFSKMRAWNVVDQRIPVPMESTSAELDSVSWVPLLDSLDGRLGDPRRFAALRGSHDGGSEVSSGDLVADTRLVGRSVWNTEWILIIPGRMLNADPIEGLRRFIDQISDIRLVFETYGYAGN